MAHLKIMIDDLVICDDEVDSIECSHHAPDGDQKSRIDLKATFGPATSESIPAQGPYTPEELATIEDWIDSTEMCRSCCQRVPKTEIAAGKHDHPAVMD